METSRRAAMLDSHEPGQLSNVKHRYKSADRIHKPDWLQTHALLGTVDLHLSFMLVAMISAESLLVKFGLRMTMQRCGPGKLKRVHPQATAPNAHVLATCGEHALLSMISSGCTRCRICHTCAQGCAIFCCNIAFKKAKDVPWHSCK